MSTDAFLSLWEAAVDRYLASTNRSEAEQAVLRNLETFDQLEKKLDDDHQTFTKFRETRVKLIRRLKYFTRPLTALSDVASGALSLSPFAPACTIFGALSFLVKAANGVSNAYDWLNQLFDRLESFIARLNEYCSGGITPQLATNAVQVLGCLLEILAQAEKTVRTGRFKKYVAGVFLGEDKDIKASLDKLTALVDHEDRLVSAITFATSQKLDKRTEGIQKTGEHTFAAVTRTELHLRKSEQSKFRTDVLQWISKANFTSLQEDTLRRRQVDTGLWFLAEPKFTTWEAAGPKQTLFCPGMKGAGKTIMAATVIDHLSRVRTKDVGLAYVYYQYKLQAERHDQSAQTMLCVILQQLVHDLQDLPKSVTDLYTGYSTNRSRPAFNEILDLLISVCFCYTTVYIVVDALDECATVDRIALISKLRGIQNTADVRLLFTSRDILEITNIFSNDPRLEVRANEDDVKLYVTHQMQGLPNCIRKDDGLRAMVVDKVAKAADGMFLIADLHVESLRHVKKPSHVRAALDRLKSKTLEEAYSDAIKRIEQQDPDDSALAWRALAWITHAKRQLTIKELCHVLSLEPGIEVVEDGDLCDIEDIVSICAGLVTVDENAGLTRLVHYTTQQYFEDLHWKTNAKLDIALDCIAYLSLSPFQSGSCPDVESFEHRLGKNAFLDYAALYWSDHVRPVQTENLESFLAFLCNGKLIDSTTQIASTYHRNPRKRGSRFHDFPRGRTGLHLTAMYGLLQLTKRFVGSYAADNLPIDVKDGGNRTPFSLAAKYGRKEIIELLLATGKVDVNSKDNFGRTPFSWAAEYGRKEVLELLLSTGKINVNSKDNRGSTPLSLAAGKGQDTIVKRLLATGIVDPDPANKSGETPLSEAARNGHQTVVELLLDRQLVDSNRVNPNSKNKEGVTPLLLATLKGKEEIVKLLLDKRLLDAGKVNPDLDAGNEFSMTPLWGAAQWGYEPIIKLLLDSGKVNPDTMCRGSTPLWEAAGEGHEGVVKLLLDTGKVNPDTECRNRTPLWQAAYNGHEGIVRLLLDTGRVDPDAKDAVGETPLLRAVCEENEDIIRLLLGTGRVDPNSQDVRGRTPLSLAVSKGLDEMVELMRSVIASKPCP